MKRFFTSESVTEGHPDKICDQIADRILDEIVKQDASARVAIEVSCTTGIVFILGEVTTTASFDAQSIARETIADIGYNGIDVGFDASTCAVLVMLDKQSPDIAQGVDASLDGNDTGAGDQGIIFGYACDETPEKMPLALMRAHALTRKLTELRKSGTLAYLRPDGKAQVSVEYEGDTVKRIDAIVLSSQHSEEVDIEDLRKDLKKFAIDPVCGDLMDENTKIYINPTGRFVVGGPHGDTGVTGRKLIVDSYGGACAHGGGALSGKDATKVDRSAAYMARYICKNIVAAKLATKCRLDLAYAIGKAQPVCVQADTFGTGKYDDEYLTELVKECFDLRPSAIIRTLQLRQPVFKETANYGHFGRDCFRWEQTDRAAELAEKANKK